MYSLKSVFTKNPIQISGAITAILNYLIIAHIVHMDSEVVAASNSVIVIILGLFIVTNTTNTAKLNEFFEPSKDPQEYS